MQGFQPLFAGNAVQHMLAQRVIASEVRVFEVILDGVMHTNGLHDLLPVSYTHLTLPTTPYV